MKTPFLCFHTGFADTIMVLLYIAPPFFQSGMNFFLDLIYQVSGVPLILVAFLITKSLVTSLKQDINVHSNK